MHEDSGDRSTGDDAETALMEVQQVLHKSEPQRRDGCIDNVVDRLRYFLLHPEDTDHERNDFHELLEKSYADRKVEGIVDKIAGFGPANACLNVIADRKDEERE